MRFYQLDTLRFVFALYVVTGHTMCWIGAVRNGQLAVDFFFVLSGFVLARQLALEPCSLKSFAMARFARLWPLHVFTLFLVLAILPQASAWEITANVFMMQDVGFFDHLTVNHPAWSVSAEFVIGILFLFPVAKYRLTLIAAILATACAIILLRATQNIDSLHTKPFGITTYGLVRCTMGCMLGYLTFEAHRALSSKIWRGWTVEALQIGATVTLLFMFAMPLNNSGKLATVGLACLVVLVLSRDGLLARVLSDRKIRWSGSLSYGIYLIHFPVLVWFILAGYLPHDVVLAEALAKGEAGVYYAPLAAFYMTVLFLAFAASRLIEMPCKKALMSSARSAHHRMSAANDRRSFTPEPAGPRSTTLGPLAAE